MTHTILLFSLEHRTASLSNILYTKFPSTTYTQILFHNFLFYIKFITVDIVWCVLVSVLHLYKKSKENFGPKKKIEIAKQKKNTKFICLLLFDSSIIFSLTGSYCQVLFSLIPSVCPLIYALSMYPSLKLLKHSKNVYN